jgi:ribonuclease BN (tRNA processing enzyme)
MSGLRLLVLGVGDAFSTLYYSSCLALEAEGAWLLIDCPHPIRKMMHEAGTAAGLPLDVAQLTGVALTHLHADHSSGLEGLGFFARFHVGRPVPLLAHPEVSAPLWAGRLACSMEWSVQKAGEPPVQRQLADFFTLVPLSEAGTVQIGPFAVQCRRTQHSIPTTALLVRAAGRCLGYSADTAFDPALLSWLSTADLVVHETNLGPIHTPYEKLASLSSDLRDKMRLIHCPDDFDRAASVIEPLRQGQCYPV